MPLSDIIKSTVIVVCFPKKCVKIPYSILDPTHKGRECTTTMHGHLPDDKKVWSSMLAHQDSANLAPTRLPKSFQQQLMLLRWKDQCQHAVPLRASSITPPER